MVSKRNVVWRVSRVGQMPVLAGESIDSHALFVSASALAGVTVGADTGLERPRVGRILRLLGRWPVEQPILKIQGSVSICSLS